MDFAFWLLVCLGVLWFLGLFSGVFKVGVWIKCGIGGDLVFVVIGSWMMFIVGVRCFLDICCFVGCLVMWFVDEFGGENK